MSADQMTSSTELTETTPNNPSAMDTSNDAVTTEVEEKPMNGADEEPVDTENKVSKRKRSTKKPIESTTESISTSRPKRNLSKREEPPSELVNGNAKTNKTKVEQTNDDADDEQERDKTIPVVYDVADVVWVKMGGHPWWPSLIIRDPNDPNGNFTKIVGNTRGKRMYFVVFYGSTADFAWVSDAALIAYQGVEAFTKYAQELVDKAQRKGEKERLTERFQLKVTISRRDDWEMAVREADEALKQMSEKRLEDVDPKIQFYTNKMAPSKGQPGRRQKTSVTKTEETPQPSAFSALDPADRSLLAEKTFEFKSEEDDSSMDTPLRKTPCVRIKLSKQQASNDSDSGPTPPTKRRYIRKSIPANDKTSNTISEQTANGSSISHQSTTPMKSTSIDLINGGNSGKKRGRPSMKQTSASSSNEESPTLEFHSASPTVTTKFTTQRKLIVKPQAFMNSSDHDIRTGFLSPFEEQEVLDALEQLGSKTFEEAEQRAKRRFEHILCLNLNRTHVDIPQEWFYTFLFSHPSLIMKNPQWFSEKNTFNDNDLLGNVQSSSGLAVLKHQLVVLSKLYRNELQDRPKTPTKKRRSTGGGKQNHHDEKEEAEELLD